MLLSFSQPAMLPYLRAGLAQRQPPYVRGPRVKRQTIRRRGPRAERLLGMARNAGWTIPYDLHLWWKSCTPERELIGVVEGGRPFGPIRVYPITILHTTVKPRYGAAYSHTPIESPGHSGVARMIWDEGFASYTAFRNFFVPNVGDRFDGILFKW